MYFVRLQLAHLHEGLKVIEEIRNDPVLKALVDRCDSQTQQSLLIFRRSSRSRKCPSLNLTLNLVHSCFSFVCNSTTGNV